MRFHLAALPVRHATNVALIQQARDVLAVHDLLPARTACSGAPDSLSRCASERRARCSLALSTSRPMPVMASISPRSWPLGAQREQRAMHGIQLQEGLLERLFIVGLLQQLFRARLVAGKQARQPDSSSCHEGNPLAATGGIDEPVVQYAQQPTAWVIRGSKLHRMLAGGNAGVLHQVLGVVGIAHQPVGHAIQHGHVRCYQPVELLGPRLHHGLPVPVRAHDERDGRM